MKPMTLPKPVSKPVESDAWTQLEEILVAGMREYLVGARK